MQAFTDFPVCSVSQDQYNYGIIAQPALRIGWQGLFHTLANLPVRFDWLEMLAGFTLLQTCKQLPCELTAQCCIGACSW